jgi:hypothetical protein
MFEEVEGAMRFLISGAYVLFICPPQAAPVSDILVPLDRHHAY